LWTLSFCESAIPLIRSTRTVPTLAAQIAAAPREKVVRTAIATLLVSGCSDVGTPALRVL
jgi:hypothetical protein